MRIAGPLVPAILLERENRFRARALLDGREVRAHLADPGRLRELVYPGARVYLRPVKNATRKTGYDLVLVRRGNLFCCVDTRMPNRILEEALQAHALPEFAGVSRIEREKVFGKSRLDFTLWRGNRRVLIEVKGVSLVVRGRGYFPDAPTVRGARHIRELTQAARQGEEAWTVFVCQRRDARSVAPFQERDPDFSHAMAEAQGAGVQFLGLSCRVTTKEMRIMGRVPVLIP